MTGTVQVGHFVDCQSRNHSTTTVQSQFSQATKVQMGPVEGGRVPQDTCLDLSFDVVVTRDCMDTAALGLWRSRGVVWCGVVVESRVSFVCIMKRRDGQ